MSKTSDPKLVILFGSRGRGTESGASDTDVAVLADHPLNAEEKNRLGEKLAEHLNVSDDKIDLVDLWDAPPLLAHQIGETGKLLSGKQSDFIRFRVLSWKRYLDTAKFRRAREKNLKEYVQRTHY